MLHVHLGSALQHGPHGEQTSDVATHRLLATPGERGNNLLFLHT